MNSHVGNAILSFYSPLSKDDTLIHFSHCLMDILGIFSKIHVEFARTKSPPQPHNNHVTVVLGVSCHGEAAVS